MGLRKYQFNERFFQEIDSEEKAYWLGFISADGCVDRRGLQLIIALGRKDKSHLIKFCSAIGWAGPIVDKVGSKKTLESWITICSVKLIADLNSLGVTPAKSQTLIPWTGPSHLMPHYWRGMIDGDGSLQMPHKTYHWWQVNLTGSQSTLKQFQSWARETCGTTAKINDRKSYWNMNIAGTQMCKKLIEKIYGDANVALERKLLLANQLIGVA
jgi:hypothetical protein